MKTQYKKIDKPATLERFRKNSVLPQNFCSMSVCMVTDEANYPSI